VSHLTYLEAIVVGAFQGVTELFPVSSLGHSVLIPALVGGSWAADLNVAAPESPYLAFIVGLHVATAAALIVFFWRDWVRTIGGLVTSIRYRQVRTPPNGWRGCCSSPPSRWASPASRWSTCSARCWADRSRPPCS
jgi:undecaprenyl-diphosphatase